MNIKIENYGDMFRFTEPSSGQIQNAVLVNSVSAVIFNFNIGYQYMLCYWLNKLLYFCKTQRDGSYQKQG